MFKEFEIRTKERTDFIEITNKIKEIVRQSAIKNGIVTIFIPHTTAGVTINEHADPDVIDDLKEYFEKLVPKNNAFKHSEGNSDAHIKASIIGSSVQVLLNQGELCLGTWQGIFFCEFDGPRKRKVYMMIKG
ncbi:secondary thiamine-phosphate synthase enzyme YjbQ [Caldicellulosiruptoraceae bacterium PP1]